MRTILWGALLLLLCLTSIALASASIPSPDVDTAEWLKVLYAAFTKGEYKIGAGLVLVGIVAGVMKWTPLKPKSKLGKIALAFTVSLMGTLGVAFAADAPIALGTFATAISTAAGAAGVWGWVKDYMASKTPEPAGS
jgi:hypothetical protein